MNNARFDDLEKRVKTIKLKKYIKLSIIFSMFVVVSYFIVSINQPNVVDKPLHVKKIAKKELQKETPKVQQFEPIKQEKKEEKKVEKKVEKKEIIVKEVNEYDTIKLSPKLNLSNSIKKDVVEVKKEKITKKSKISLRVKEVKSEDALLERFRAAGDFDSAMGLAHLYFDKQNFEKSIYWSKKASKLRSGEESAWLVYAKSKKALDKTEDAIKALQLYLEYFSSESIEKLLKLYRDKK